MREIVWTAAHRVEMERVGGEGAGVEPVGDEYEPRFSADGTEMVFVRRKPGENADIYFSRLKAVEGAGGVIEWVWGEATAIASIQSEADELGPEFSAGGDHLYFYSDRAGGLGGYDLWVVKKDGEAWGAAENLGAGVNTRFNEYAPALTPDGKTLYFASNRVRPGETMPADDAWRATIRERRDRHDYDVYASSIVDGAAGEARGVAGVNTAADEGSPAVSPAGDFLYFASDRAGGLGGYDIYRVRLGDEARWRPENLGSSVNSGANELDPGLSTDGFRLYFSSNRAWGAEGGAADGADDVRGAVADGRVYRLWQSSSREVYFEARPLAAGLLEFWNRVWPWLALLVASVLLGWLLARLIRSEAWRRRFARLSLLAQCLIVSCMVHALIATGLAAWEVGQGVIDLVKGEQGGGTRVILSSASGLDSMGGESGGGVIGQITSSAVVIPDGLVRDVMPDSEAAAIEGRVEASMASIMPDAMVMPVLSMFESAEAAGTNGGVREMPRVEVGGAEQPEMSLPSAREAVAASEERAEMQGVAGQGVEMVPAPEARVEAGGGDGPALGAMDMEGTPAGPVAVRESVGTSGPLAASGLAMQAMQGGGGGGEVSSVLPRVGGKSAREEVSAAGVGGANAAAVDGNTMPTSPAIVEAPRSLEPVTPGRMAGLDAGVREGLVPRVGEAGSLGSVQERVAVGVAGLPRVEGEVALGAAIPRAGGGVAVREVERGHVQGETGAGAGLGEVMPSTGAGGMLTELGRELAQKADVAVPEMKVGGQGAGGLAGERVGAREAAERVNAGRIAAGQALMGRGEPGASAALPSVARRGSAGNEEAKAGSTLGEGVVVGGGDGPAMAGVVGLEDGRTGDREDGPRLMKMDAGLAGDGGVALKDVREATPAEGVARTGNAGGVKGAGGVPIAASGKGPGEEFGIRLPEIPTEQVDPLESFAQRAPEVRSELLEKMGGSRETEAAVGRALGWLARHQGDDGRWSSRGFDASCGSCDDAATVDADVAMTGMALLCYLGAGHTHMGEGPYREVVSKGIEWLLSRQDGRGDMRGRETMYGQTVATVALCEALSMTKDERLKEPARRAADFVVGVAAAPRRAGEQVRPEDTSVIGWLVMTVESARRAGIPVPPEVYLNAGRWLERVASREEPGGYAYKAGERATAAMTAEAMFVQQILGRRREDPMMRRSAEYLLRQPPAWREGAPTHSWYYATLALFEQQGESWKTWNASMREELLRGQRRDGGAAGSWDPQDEWSRLGGRIYQTAVCTLCLEVYYRYAPSESKAEGGEGGG